MTGARFERAPLARVECTPLGGEEYEILESTALDHSAIQPFDGRASRSWPTGMLWHSGDSEKRSFLGGERGGGGGAALAKVNTAMDFNKMNDNSVSARSTEYGVRSSREM